MSAAQPSGVSTEWDARKMLQALTGATDLAECALLSTCNRSEVYAVTRASAWQEQLLTFLAAQARLSPGRRLLELDAPGHGGRAHGGLTGHGAVGGEHDQATEHLEEFIRSLLFGNQPVQPVVRFAQAVRELASDSFLRKDFAHGRDNTARIRGGVPRFATMPT